MHTETAVRSAVPNKPKTKTRGFRIPDDEYAAAQEAAQRKGETLTDIVRRALAAYVRRNR
jgi:predicted HicB family RNase H-like nuclease